MFDKHKKEKSAPSQSVVSTDQGRTHLLPVAAAVPTVVTPTETLTAFKNLKFGRIYFVFSRPRRY